MKRHQRRSTRKGQGDDRSPDGGAGRGRPAADSGPGREERSGPDRVLVVDDNEDCRRALASFLEASGYRVGEATDGEEAVRAAREFAPDLILLDIMMPGVDGLEAARRIRGTHEFDGVRIVAITAMEGAEQASLAAGCDACVSKPLDMSEFPARVDRWLGEG